MACLVLDRVEAAGTVSHHPPVEWYTVHGIACTVLYAMACTVLYAMACTVLYAMACTIYTPLRVVPPHA